MQRGGARRPQGPAMGPSSETGGGSRRATQLSKEEADQLREVSSQVTVDPALLKLGLTGTAAITVKDHVKEGKRDNWEDFKKNKLENELGEEKARLEYRKQLDAERAKRLEQVSGKKVSSRKSSKKKKKEKKKNKKKKKKKKKATSGSDSESDSGSESDSRKRKRKNSGKSKKQRKKHKRSDHRSRSPSPVQLSSFFSKESGGDSSESSSSD
mmetsp:Transcript_15456/g.19141  ORF Transcript_15456/g.19141 Transcript_15456/m.19141 type:complete len:212 (+) Transcript_15456:225-860(+)|eukprot:CAMPEP_0204829946 /NCGR_PEP_ID=MMETSP1346-20131115/8236_1 /ASSEMBLY_ACC=CAM_ASM_000771 /TAXON_ID=215587 /ORGANISM="Aplanochytrium stocchinoi, Strain GSBS06" /LENGTH=211 /DNA_ID=CAMNT_0051960043 /DNA_START=236 /DNA_END=871 /DNA_ORIENTATION=+